MVEYKFNVLLEDSVVARNMTLEVALILVEGLYNKYYLEDNMKVSIQKVKANGKDS